MKDNKISQTEIFVRTYSQNKTTNIKHGLSKLSDLYILLFPGF